MQVITMDANCVAAFVQQLAALDHETRANVRAMSDGQVWAALDVSPMTDSQRAAFPTDASGVRGDTHKRGQAGVMFDSGRRRDSLSTAIQRSRRMIGRARRLS